MKYIIFLLSIATCALSGRTAVAPRYNKPVVLPTPIAQHTLAQDLEEIARLIPTKELRRLAIRYLINDAQFQTFVRIINSHDGYITQMRFRSQPEVRSFTIWVRNQIQLSGGELSSDESNESLRIINRTPFWSQNVFGWPGFVNEFHSYYPEETLQMHIQTKASQSAEFAEFVQRLKNLKPAYDRVIAAPETKRLINALEANGIATSVIDYFIRNQFGWQHTANSTTAGIQ